MMHITYDKEADAAYIRLRKASVHKTHKVGENTMIDYDEQGQLIGIEILDASRTYPELLSEPNVIQLA